ncbi:MAG TPA: hypothetical protein VHX66_01430 [Solirubrobacteraceae bacterium]|jgi:hypothetical protein|nr:hypothetical protein [Solirubrobacteraceae bacterium]
MLVTIAVAAAVAAPLSSASAARSRDTRSLPKGSLMVIFSGSGGGSYRYHEPARGSGSACHSADTTYTEADNYRWYYRFVLPPAGGATDTPVATSGGGQLQGTEQLTQCAGSAALTSTCTQNLQTPLASSATDLAYPGIVVGGSARTITVGAIGELVPSALQCSGLSIFAPNPIQGFSQLQASVSFDRAALQESGDEVRHFTMAGSGLYDGVTLSASCSSTSCDTNDCTLDATPAGGPPVSCNYNESYSGTIEIRVVK